MDKNCVIHRYDAFASRYLRHYTRPKSILSLEKIRRAQILVDHLAEVQPSEVLDLGCGPGYVLWRLTQRLPTIEPFGLDLSSEMLKVAYANYGAIIPFIMGDIENLPFPPYKFAAVFALGVLEKFHSLNRLISEVARVIKSKGTFIFSYPNRYSYCSRIRRVGGYLRNGKSAKSNNHLLGFYDLTMLLRQYDFEVQIRLYITYGNGIITFPWSMKASVWIEKILGQCELGRELAMTSVWVVQKR